MEHVLVQAQVGHQLLELPVLFLDLAQPPQLDDHNPGKLPLPAVKDLLAHAQLAADLHGWDACFRLAQSMDDLFLGKSTLLQSRPSFHWVSQMPGS